MNGHLEPSMASAVGPSFDPLENADVMGAGDIGAHEGDLTSPSGPFSIVLDEADRARPGILIDSSSRSRGHLLEKGERDCV